MHDRSDSAAAKLPDDSDKPARHLGSIGAIPAIQQGPVASLATEVFAPLVGGPGTLARALAAVSEAGCNIAGYAEVAGTLHLLTDGSRAARAAFAKAGFLPTEADVVVLSVVDRPGIATKVFRLVADAKIDVLVSYMATNNRMVIGVSNPVEVLQILNGL
jgi:hypothetical protein